MVVFTQNIDGEVGSCQLLTEYLATRQIILKCQDSLPCGHSAAG